MSKHITLRKMKKEDYAFLENIIRNTWHYDSFLSPSAARKMARVYLRSCLSNQTFIRIASEEEKPIGVIMVKKNDCFKVPLRRRLALLLSVFSLLISREGRFVSRNFKDIRLIDEQLLENAGQKFDAEIAFFAVDAAYRGRQIGRRLFDSAILYMQKSNIKNFFLFTDTSCNYHFYDHLGLTRRGKANHCFDTGKQKADMIFYIYEGSVPVTSH